MNNSTNTGDVPNYVGECDAKILQWAHDKVNDKPCIKVLCGIVSGPLRGRRIEACLWLTPSAIDHALRQLEAGGYKGGGLKRLEGFGSVNVSLRIGVETARESGRTFPKVEWINPIRTIKVKGQLDDAELDELDELVAKREAERAADEHDVDDVE